MAKLQKLKKRKKEGVMTLGGKIITIAFIILLIAGGYFLYTLFRPVDITSVNMAGEWEMNQNGSKIYYYFEPGGSNADGTTGTVSVYRKAAGTGTREDVKEYDFTLELHNDVIHMQMVQTSPKADRGNEVLIKITALSNAQMGIIYNSADFANLRKTNIF